MFILNFILFILIPKIIITNITEIISLNAPSGTPYIKVEIGNEGKIYNMIFDTSLHRSLLVNPNCKICTKEGFPVINSKKISNNQTEFKYHYTFYGDEYEENAKISQKINKFKMDFISFTNVSFTTQIGTSGFFSLSFTNYHFNSEKKIFAIQYNKNIMNLHIGDYSSDIVKNLSLLKKYPIKYNKNKTQWFIESDDLLINNKTIRNKEKQKLIFDTSTNNLYIPNKFFFDNIDNIFPQDANCQILTSGIFLCECDENYITKFGNFQFNISGEILFINVTDYIGFDSSITGSSCYVSININYNNEYWITGNNVLNNYYPIFDIDNNSLYLYTENINYEANTKYFLIFFLVFCISNLIFFGGYYLYKKNVIDAEDE